MGLDLLHQHGSARTSLRARLGIRYRHFIYSLMARSQYVSKVNRPTLLTMTRRVSMRLSTAINHCAFRHCPIARYALFCYAACVAYCPNACVSSHLCSGIHTLRCRCPIYCLSGWYLSICTIHREPLRLLQLVWHLLVYALISCEEV